MGTDADEVAGLLRQGDPDRYFATLFAPQSARPHMFALYAFSLEIAQIRERISDPMPGEIRLQWWRDILAGSARGGAGGHPVAAALLHTIETFALPVAPFEALIDARVFDLYDDPMPTLNDLEGYCGETSSALIRLAAMILANGDEPGLADEAGHGGVAYALTGLLRALPIHARRGQVYLPGDVMAAHGVTRDDIISGRTTPQVIALLKSLREIAADHFAKAKGNPELLRGTTGPAFLPLALVRPYQIALAEAEPFGQPASLPQWRRQWILWRTARRQRF